MGMSIFDDCFLDFSTRFPERIGANDTSKVPPWAKEAIGITFAPNGLLAAELDRNLAVKGG